MNTKTLLLLGALGAAGMTSAVAQTNVYSVNAVGYINLTLPTGFSLIANQLNSTNNTIGSLLTGLPNFSNFYKFVPGTGFDIATLVFGAWDKPNLTLNPGEGGFVNLGSPGALTFVGEVPQGSLTNAAPKASLSARATDARHAAAKKLVLPQSCFYQSPHLPAYCPPTNARQAWE